MITTKLTFDATGWLEINYIQTTQLPDVVTPAVPEVPAVYAQVADDMGEMVQGDLITPAIPEVPEKTTPGGTTEVILQSTSYHPTQLDLIQADCAKHGVEIEGEDAEAVAEWHLSYVPPPPAPVPVPAKVTMRQARLALLAAGKLAAVNAALAALPSPQKEAAQIEWEYSQEVQRHNGFVSLLAPVLGMDGEALDALFITAAGL